MESLFKKRFQHRYFLVNIAKFVRIAFLKNSPSNCFRQSYHSTVKWARASVHRFCTSMCFWSWSKTCTKHCTNSSLLSRDKTVFFSIDQYFRFENIFWKNITQIAQITRCNVTCTKTLLFACTLWLMNSFQFQDMIWKMKDCFVSKNIKNMAVKKSDFDCVLLLCTLLTFSSLYCSCKFF